MRIKASEEPISIERFMAMRDESEYELFEGRLIPRRPSGAHSSCVGMIIATTVGRFLNENPCAWLFGPDAIYACFGSDMTARRVDISLVRFGRFTREQVPKLEIEITPDLAIEVISPEDLAYEVAEKVDAYLHAGTPLVWVVYPNSRSVEIRRIDGTVTVLHAEQMISGEGVLSGFEAVVGDLFPDPNDVRPWNSAIRDE
jgi:Uma2 family endonuclease